MNTLDFSKIQDAARTAMNGEVVAIVGTAVIIRRNEPIWDDRPFVFTHVCHQPDNTEHEYSFHTSTYDLDREGAEHVLRYSTHLNITI